jgi:hypothetical protein
MDVMHNMTAPGFSSCANLAVLESWNQSTPLFQGSLHYVCGEM